MKVVLLGEIKGKGGEGDVIDVAQGYAENYLIPQKLAVAATKGNLKQLEERRHNIEKREAVRLADAKVGDEGQLFGSVTNTMVADAIKNELGVEVERKRIELNRAIKTSGLHTVKVSLYREIAAELHLQVGKPAVEEVVEEAPEAEVAETEAAEETTEAAE